MNDPSVSGKRRSKLPNKFRRWFPRRSAGDHFPTARFVLATFIVLLWIAFYIRAFTDQEFQVPGGLGAIAFAAATYLFGSGLLGKKGNDE